EPAHLVAQAWPGAVVFLGQGDHRRSDIDAVTLPEMACQGLRQPARPAAEVEGPAPAQGEGERLGVAPDAADLFLPPGRELVVLPFAVPFVGLGQDGPEGVGLSEGVPVPLHFLELHVCRPWLKREKDTD